MKNTSPKEFMQINHSEKLLYFKYLKKYFGREIVHEDDLNTEYQRHIEIQRHKFNSYFESNIGGLDLNPKRLLINITQKCTFSCQHCWVFGSPSAKSSLSLNDLKSIEKNILSDNPPNWTISGGEFFCLPYYPKVLEQFPIQCVYSNAFWGHPEKKSQEYTEKIAKALDKNLKINKNRFTLILSYDIYHIKSCGANFPLSIAIARIIDTFYKKMPEISIRISHTLCKDDENKYNPIIKELENFGFEITKTEQDDNHSNINTISYSYTKENGIVKELFIDIFPATYISRGLFLEEKNELQLFEKQTIIENNSFRYQYTIGPDGGLGLYEILYAPPVPYFLGRLVDESWKTIEERLMHDPIAMTLKKEGIKPILHFMDIYYHELFNSISTQYQTIQQILYLILLNPGRRLLLNTYLLSELVSKEQSNVTLRTHYQKIISILDNTNKAEREKENLNLYKINN
jgi:hypothetical protein